MSELEFIKNTPSDVLIKSHLKLVFDTYFKLFGEVCTGCAHKISGYIKRIKNHKIEIMSQAKSNFKLKGNSLIIIPGTNKSYSNANLTDEVAIAYLKKNINRKVLFASLPKNLDELLNGSVDQTLTQTTETSEDKTLDDYTMAELKEKYPEAKGKTKVLLIASIQEIINQAAAKAEQEEEEEEEESEQLGTQTTETSEEEE